MDNLLKNIESMEITNTQELIINKIITNIENLINNCLVPQKLIGIDRPCDKNDFNDYSHTIDGNLIDLLAELNNLKNYNVDSRSLSIEDVDVREILLKSVIIIGEQSEKNPWNNSSTLELANKLLIELCWFFAVDKFSDVFANNDQDNRLRDILLLLRGKLLKSTWKTFPGSVCCYKWLLHQVEMPGLLKYLTEVLPTALIIYDDYVPENRIVGLICIRKILEHSSLWTKRDDILATLLNNMELENNLELRHAYITSLPQLLTNIGCAKWCERLIRILSEYCGHHTDLKTLKATLQFAEIVLSMFHVRIPAHCLVLYTAFLKLHYDLTETPIFDEEIIRSLERCIYLLYKVTPNIGSAIIRDDRMRIIIKNSIHTSCFSDTKYCN
ncbi:Similar to TTI2: TELO2-interacting protein 2 (Homo sapiens) [Cotesia congregata]|uniref:Similar to TTI2: TELO2-interacting protein 2 (Homo sapiens) n=1 Tax=Cotesia congregata TaxID=51543 RepID=A0A8J2H0E0_COTCN|nr:Similar to TTI2: TELO2-interacting protein 2 (Homo sapiens) [Cotesia congregata]